MQHRNRTVLLILARTSAFVAAFGFCHIVAAGPAFGADDESITTNGVDHDAELLRIWWTVAGGIGADEPWSLCRTQLADGIAWHGASKYAADCKKLLESIDLAQARSEMPPPKNVRSDAERLVADLWKSRVHYRVVLWPHRYITGTDKLTWDHFAETHPDMLSDPAYMLYRRGRSVIPLLIGALSDRTATRVTRTNQNNSRMPLAMRVCDIALALIEGISHCRFPGHSGSKSLLLSEWPVEDQRMLTASVQAWWDATQDMSPIEAMLWQMRHGSRRSQIEMLDMLIGMGKAGAAVRFLDTRYHNGDTIDIQFASRMLRAGSREPLEFIHRVVRSGGTIDHVMVRLIKANGQRVDYALLRDVFAQDRSEERRVGKECRSRWSPYH